ncbi:LON peptidase substrate-binding domain-containing protein [Salinisphaera sp. SWV1]|uniref:LON peptidase substrate-binding domain-containing protein n=1 Tax=Salinisphaera sp. SWV1 TaxID=3454139 RepID=UPI003F8666BD
MPYTEHALFPLSTVVFPGGLLPLRIFEPRYLDMVSHCMRSQDDFVVCTARPARHGDFAEPRAMGTRVSIVDFDRLSDGALGITAHGHTRVAIEDTRQSANGLWWGEVTPVDETSDGPCPIEFAPLKEIVAALIADAGLTYDSASVDYDSASWLSARLTELLPFDAATKHDLLTTDDPQERLRRIRPMIEIENTGTRSRR